MNDLGICNSHMPHPTNDSVFYIWTLPFAISHSTLIDWSTKSNMLLISCCLFIVNCYAPSDGMSEYQRQNFCFACIHPVLLLIIFFPLEAIICFPFLDLPLSMLRLALVFLGPKTGPVLIVLLWQFQVGSSYIL